MKIGRIKDDHNQAAVCIVLKKDEETKESFFFAIQVLFQSSPKGIISLLGPSKSDQNQSEYFDRFTSHLQNHARQGEKWIISSVPIKAFTGTSGGKNDLPNLLQIIDKESLSEKLKVKMDELEDYSKVSWESFGSKEYSSVILVLDSEFKNQVQGLNIAAMIITISLCKSCKFFLRVS